MMTREVQRIAKNLHEKAGHLEAFVPATAQDFHELADEVAALEAEKPLAEGWLYAISRTIPEGTIRSATFSAYNPGWADQRRVRILPAEQEAAP